MTLEVHNAGAPKPVHEIQVRSAVQWRSIHSVLIYMEPESVLCYRSDYSGRASIRTAVLNWAFLIMELFKSGPGRHETKVVELLHCKNFNIKATQNMVKIVNRVASWCEKGSVQCSKIKEL